MAEFCNSRIVFLTALARRRIEPDLLHDAAL